LNQTLIVGDQPVSLTNPFARNDPTGAWEIHATGLAGSQSWPARLNLH